MGDMRTVLRSALKIGIGVVVVVVGVYWWMLPWTLLGNFVGLDSRSSSFWGQAHAPLTFGVGLVVVLVYYLTTVLLVAKLWKLVGVIQGRRHDRLVPVVAPN